MQAHATHLTCDLSILTLTLKSHASYISYVLAAHTHSHMHTATCQQPWQKAQFTSSVKGSHTAIASEAVPTILFSKQPKQVLILSFRAHILHLQVKQFQSSSSASSPNKSSHSILQSCKKQGPPCSSSRNLQPRKFCHSGVPMLAYFFSWKHH